MIQRKPLAWTLFSLFVLTDLYAVAQDSIELVPEDTCVVELTLPRGSTVKLQDRDYGTRRKITYNPLTPGKTYTVSLEIRYPSGKTTEHTLLLKSGRRVRFSQRDAAARVPELALQTGHRDDVNSVAFSPDGRILVTGSDDDTAILWDTSTGRKLRTLHEHSKPVNAVAFSPDDSGRVLTASNDGTTILWNAETGKKLRVFELDKGGMDSVAFSPDGKMFAVGTGTVGKSAIIWNTQTGQRLRTFEGHSESVDSVVFSPDGRILATGSSDNTAILWDVQTGRKLRSLKVSSLEFNSISMAFSPDGQTLATGSWDNTAILWDVQTARKLRTLRGHSSYIRSLSFSPDSRTLATCSSDDTAILWDVQTGQEVRKFEGHSDQVFSVAFSPDGRTLATGSLDKTAILWDVQAGRKLRVLQGHSDNAPSVAYRPDGWPLLAVRSDNTAVLWNTSARQKLRALEGHRDTISEVVFSPNGQTMATASEDETVIHWDVQTGRKLQTLKEVSTFGTDVVAFSPNGQQLLTADSFKVILWDLATGRKVRTFEGNTSAVRSVAFSSDGRRVLSGSNYYTVLLWDAATGRKLRLFEADSNRVHSVGFSANGRQFLTGYVDGDITATLWGTATGKRLQSFKGHSNWTTNVIFSPDGRQLLSGSWDKTAILWDSATGEKLRTFQGHSDWVISVVFSPDGGHVLTGSRDGTARLWDIATGLELVRFIGIGMDDWLLVTPEGLFDGSEGGMQEIGYRIGEGLNVVPVERFFQDFYRPGLLASIMRGERPLPSVEMGKELPPEVQIVSPTRGGETEEDVVMIEAVIEDQGGGIKTPWIMQNETRVAVDSEPVREGDKLRWKFELELIDGENKIKVQSASADGSWESEPATITFIRSEPTEKTELYLLAIGVSKYADESANLQYAAADAEAFGKLFRTRGAGCYGEGRVHVETLLDKEATSQKIEKAIEKIAEQAGPQDVFMLTLSGHGIMVGQRYFFLPHEFTSKDEGGWQEDAKKHGLPGDVLQTWINKVPALKRVVVYDTCQSGGAIAVAGLSRNPFEFQRAFETFRRSTGCHVIAAATASQNAEEIEDLGHGALTYALLAGLGAVDRGPFKNRTAESRDGLVQVRDWLGFAAENVPSLTKTYYGREQLVDVFGEGRSFPILRVDDDKP